MAFVCQQGLFHGRSAAEPAGSTAAANHPMTGDEQRIRIGSHGIAHKPRRPGFSQLHGDIEVRSDSSVGDFSRDAQHPLLQPGHSVQADPLPRDIYGPAGFEIILEQKRYLAGFSTILRMQGINSESCRAAPAGRRHRPAGQKNAIQPKGYSRKGNVHRAHPCVNRKI